MIACHANDISDDNVLWNLRWDTYAANAIDARANKRWPWLTQTHCKNGHPYDEENTHVRPGTNKRECRACARDRYHASKNKQLIAA